jgi:hypothetical protein
MIVGSAYVPRLRQGCGELGKRLAVGGPTGGPVNLIEPFGMGYAGVSRHSETLFGIRDASCSKLF